MPMEASFCSGRRANHRASLCLGVTACIMVLVAQLPQEVNGQGYCISDNGAVRVVGTTEIQYGYSVQAAPAGHLCSEYFGATRNHTCVATSSTTAAWEAWKLGVGTTAYYPVCSEQAPISSNLPTCSDSTGKTYPAGTTYVEYGYSLQAAPTGHKCSEYATARYRLCLATASTTAAWGIWTDFMGAPSTNFYPMCMSDTQASSGICTDAVTNRTYPAGTTLTEYGYSVGAAPLGTWCKNFTASRSRTCVALSATTAAWDYYKNKDGTPSVFFYPFCMETSVNPSEPNCVDDKGVLYIPYTGIVQYGYRLDKAPAGHKCNEYPASRYRLCLVNATGGAYWDTWKDASGASAAAFYPMCTEGIDPATLPNCVDEQGTAYPAGTTVTEYGYSAAQAPYGTVCKSLMTVTRSRTCSVLPGTSLTAFGAWAVSPPGSSFSSVCSEYSGTMPTTARCYNDARKAFAPGAVELQLGYSLAAAPAGSKCALFLVSRKRVCVGVSPSVAYWDSWRYSNGTVFTGSFYTKCK